MVVSTKEYSYRPGTNTHKHQTRHKQTHAQQTNTHARTQTHIVNGWLHHGILTHIFFLLLFYSELLCRQGPFPFHIEKNSPVISSNNSSTQPGWDLILRQALKLPLTHRLNQGWVRWISSCISSVKNTVSDAEIDGGLMAILYRDYFDSVKIPTGINLTPNFLHIRRQCLISSGYLQRQLNNMISIFPLPSDECLCSGRENLSLSKTDFPFRRLRRHVTLWRKWG